MKTNFKLLSGYSLLLMALTAPALGGMGGHSHPADAAPAHQTHGPTPDERAVNPGMQDELMQRIMANHAGQRELLDQMIQNREFMDQMIERMMQDESTRDLMVERVLQDQEMRSRIVQRVPRSSTKKPLNPKTIGRGRRFQ